jgi:hypothetical protein
MPRASELPLDPSGPSPLSQHVVAVEERNRIRLPASLVSSVTWLAKPGDDATALMVLEVPGRICLRSWEQFGEGVLARRRQLIQEVEEGDTAAEEELLLLEDRYHRVQLPKERRLTLTARGVLHLGLAEGARSSVYVARVFDRIVIMSPAYRDDRLRTGSVALSDLP